MSDHEYYPQPSDEEPNMRCPKCGSKDVTCESTRKAHTHTCKACGYQTVASGVQP